MGQETVAGWRAVLAGASAGYVPGPLTPPAPGDPSEVGPYRVQAVLGQGGMGRVFLAARDSPDGAVVPIAVKVLSRTSDATARTRFRRELTAARRVRGEGTARVLDGDADADPPWLATEYISGPTLDQLVAASGPLGGRAGAALAVGVAGALATIHASGIVHRDLKPANIILGPDGPRVVDFGIARTEDATTLSITGWAMGTPGYMAPEQIAEPREAGPAADVFALGAVLVFATTGASPYAGGDPSTVVYRIVHGSPRMDGVPGPLRELVAASLARDPAARPRLEAIAAAGLRLVDELGREPDPAEGAADAAAAAAETTAVPIRAAISRRTTGNQGESGKARAAVPGIALPDVPGAADPTARTAKPAVPGPPRAAGLARGARPLRRRGVLGLLVVLVLAAVGVGGWFAASALGRPTGSATAGHTGGAGPSSAHASAGGTKKAATRGAAAFSGGTTLAGPGCASSPWSVFFITSGGSLETGVGGGYAGCGGSADAFRKSGETGTPSANAAHAEWRFDFKRAVVCTLQIYVADTDPSSGSAVYQVVADGAVRSFTLSQADHKGAFVGAPDLTGLAAPDGVVRLTLTDAGPYAGDQGHVTASAVTAACRLG